LSGHCGRIAVAQDRLHGGVLPRARESIGCSFLLGPCGLFDRGWHGRFILRQAQDEVFLLRVDAMKNPASC
jgi:hypothetical protein